jgi:hypothetical protein
MAKSQLTLNGSSFSISKRQLIMQCDLFKKNPSLLEIPYSVRSYVSTSSLEAFLSAIDDNQIEVGSSNCGDLSALSGEFGFSGLQEILSAFQSSQPHFNSKSSELLSRIAILEKRTNFTETGERPALR